MSPEGHSFQVISTSDPAVLRVQSHKRAKRERQRESKLLSDKEVRAGISVIIPAETCKKVPVRFTLPSNSTFIYVEKTLFSHRNIDDVYGCPDSILTSEHPFLHISNFSNSPVRIHEGQSLGIRHNPRNWLDRVGHDQNDVCIVHAKLVQTLAKALSHDQSSKNPNPPNSDPVEGGPKAAETPEDPIPTGILFEVLHLSPELTPLQKEAIQRVVLKNITAFSVDGRLGHYDNTMVDFPMKSDAKPVSLPPFGASSPEKRRIIDEQMDSWLNLEVIEPSVSPWGAPAFIVYRQGKPRMVIDYRRLNELIIPDEFPLPRQDDILQTLTGANWLSTLDALASTLR